MIVLDSSAAIDYLAGRQWGAWVEPWLEREGDVHVPQLFDLEVAAAMRRFAIRGIVPGETAAAIVRRLQIMRIARYPHLPLMRRIWALRDNVSPYDAAYVALARQLHAPLLTTDLRLARTPGLPVDVIAP